MLPKTIKLLQNSFKNLCLILFLLKLITDMINSEHIKDLKDRLVALRRYL